MATSLPNKEALTILDAQLTCAICLDRYTDPRTLFCHHNFCKDCIIGLYGGELKGERQVVNCPTCRRPTQLDGDKGAYALPPAFSINSLLEIDELLKKVPESEPQQDCSAHNKPRDIYCETCEKLICIKCVETHHGHQYDRAADLFEKHKQQIEECLQPMKKKIDDITQALIHFDFREKEIIDNGKAVQKEIDVTIQQLIDRLQKSRRTLAEKVATAVQDKLQLHSCQRTEVEAVLVQMKSCQEFIEKELRLRPQHQIQAAKKELVQRINDTHSKVKVSELQPAQKADTVYVKNRKALSTCSCMGNIQSTLIMGPVPGLVSVDIPKYVMAGTRVEVYLTTPVSLSSKLFSSQLIPARCKPIDCPVTTIFEGQFSVMIHPTTAGPHQLRVQISGADIYGSPFTLPVLYSAELRKKMLTDLSRGLRSPCGVAVTNDGQHVVVVEWNAHCVTVLTANGELVRRFGSYGRDPGKFSRPWGVAVSADNHIFVADTMGMLQKFTFTGVYVASASLKGFGLAVHQDGRVYSINSESCKVDVFHPDLKPSHSFGEEVCFTKPCDVAIDANGMVYVTDCYKCEVLKFTSEGQYLISIGSKGKRLDQFSWPLGIAVDSDGIIYVAETDKHQVMMFTTEGAFLGSFGSTGEQVLQPRGVAVDKTGNLYICESSRGGVLVSRLLYSP